MCTAPAVTGGGVFANIARVKTSAGCFPKNTANLRCWEFVYAPAWQIHSERQHRLLQKVRKCRKDEDTGVGSVRRTPVLLLTCPDNDTSSCVLGSQRRAPKSRSYRLLLPFGIDAISHYDVCVNAPAWTLALMSNTSLVARKARNSLLLRGEKCAHTGIHNISLERQHRLLLIFY